MTYRTRLSLLFLFVVLSILLAVGYGGWKHRQRDDLPEGIYRANGRLELTRTDIAAKYPGRLLSLHFREGDAVEAGQVLGIQEDAELRAKMAQARATLAKAESERARARAEHKAHGYRAALARLDWEQAKMLFGQREISQVELDRRRFVLDAETSSQAAVADAVATAGHAVGEAQAQIELIQAMLDGLQLRAPIAGRVEYRIVEPGTVLSPGGRIATLLDTEDVYLTVFYPAEVVARLKIGDEARVVLQGYAGRPLPASVSMIDADAQFTPKYVETNRERQNLMYRVKLSIPRGVAQDLQGQLKGGITGDGYVRAPDADWPQALRAQSKSGR